MKTRHKEINKKIKQCICGVDDLIKEMEKMEEEIKEKECQCIDCFDEEENNTKKRKKKK